MIHIHRAKDRGHFDYGWLNTWHTFSFGDFSDPERCGFHRIRVINQDRIVPGSRFETHFHQDMEIVSYIVEGALGHIDSFGNGSSIRPGEVHYLGAGTGVTHSEFNQSQNQATEFLQIWIPPNVEGAAPTYDQRVFSTAARLGQLCLVASGDGRDKSIRIRQNLDIHASLLKTEQRLSTSIDHNAAVWLQLIRGSLVVNDHLLDPGDGLCAEDVARLDIRSRAPGDPHTNKAEFLLIVMPLGLAKEAAYRVLRNLRE